MFDKWFGVQAHKSLHFIGALILVVGIPMNKVLMSTGTIWLAANLLINADFNSYWKNIKNSKLALTVIAILLLHFIGITYSTDFDYAISDINRKLPFFVLPIVLIAYPIDKMFYKDLLHALLASLVITSIANLFLYYFAEDKISDMRYLSQFGSHIRYGVLIVFGAFISLYFAFKEKNKSKWMYLLLFLYFSFYTLFSQVITAYFNYSILLIFIIILLTFKLKNLALKWVIVSLIGVFVVFSGFSIYNFLKPDLPVIINVEELDAKTSKGNRYNHYGEHHYLENGHPIMVYICEKELEEEWNKVSELDYNGFDNKNQILKGTLIRYMTSKGLRKDAEGVKQLSRDDINNIEKGVASIKAIDNSILYRLEGLKFQIHNYLMGGDPSGHSLLQRFEHWRAAIHIIENNPIFGVGTGDAQLAFNKTYVELDSPLQEEYRNRSHNQFFSFYVSFGALGFLLLLYFSFLLFKIAFSNRQTILLIFAILIFLSFLPEDTLETQQGATFVGFFTGFLAVSGKKILPK